MYLIRIIFLPIIIFACSAIDNKEVVAVKKAFPELEFVRPVDLQQPDSQENYLYVVEQAGRIYKFENTPETDIKIPVLDIRDRVNDSGNEEGLLGLAFHPQFAQNSLFYVNYTADNPRRTVIARFKMENTADATAASKFAVLEYSQPYGNHNGGQVMFGPDGFLYIAVGDGGSGGDPQGNGQNRKTLLGSILRIDVDKEENGKAYAIPSDNPFAGNDQGFREEIFAYGLRNPWRFCFHPETRDIWTGDVGQNKIEEIDIVVNGGNYGWNIMEASECYNADNCDKEGLILPIYEYTHAVGYSITGGYIYQGSSYPELYNSYIYADFVVGKIWALESKGNNVYKNSLLTEKIPQISSFGQDKDKNLFVLSFDGYVYKFGE
ncbi:MAG: PQQ-dependent sugar dehydrogenase [Calditrichaeota bacterium]|nr:PQQ-dependent sugar dehydrogenase [Calditrichota bacterium]